MAKLNEIPINKKVKVVFKSHDQRFPQIGKFVQLQDAKHLASKGMVRFVNANRIDDWDDNNPDQRLTKIYVANDFLHILIVRV